MASPWDGDGGNVYIRSTRSSYKSQEQRLRELVTEGLEKSNKVKLGDGYLVRIPQIKGRICRIKRDNSTYVEYIYDRGYDPETKKSWNKKAVIGTILFAYPNALFPNDNYEKYFDIDTGKPKILAGEDDDGAAGENEAATPDEALEPKKASRRNADRGTKQDITDTGVGDTVETTHRQAKPDTDTESSDPAGTVPQAGSRSGDQTTKPWSPENMTEEEKRRSKELTRNGMKAILDSAIRFRLQQQEKEEQKEREQYDLELYGEKRSRVEPMSLEELIAERKRLDEEDEEFNSPDHSGETEKRDPGAVTGGDYEAGQNESEYHMGTNGNNAYSEEELQKTYEDVNAFRERVAILADILTKIHESIKTQAKRRPDDIISLFKAQKINSILAELKEKYDGTGYDDLLELIEEPHEVRKDDEIYVLGPTYSDVEVLLDHYASILHFIKVKKK